MPRSAHRLSAAAVVAAALLLTVTSSAYADHDDRGTDPDNRNQAVKGFSLTTNGTNAMNHGKSELERSVINTSWGGGDIEVFDANYGKTGWHGTTDCTDWNALWTSCDIIRVRLNTYQSKTASQWRSLGCHEFGHTADLGHRGAGNDKDNNSCMRVEIWPTRYDQHDLNAIKAGT
ncbi:MULTISPECIES: hypothetical protein [Streptomyces]|uniref:Matrixin family metalloprotease n=1 Tax=Streptomyces cyaneofuscatus TaxID=66883 RepID=A0ABZ1EUG4_9ACTN|nr:hypothetical protein [Streptomyces cyaneofuscatus]WSB07695.1 hypothetical protein OG849_10740 [Streptomyces cyaneofuscatus]WSD48772.1 hypothetical protein OG857_24660 [Streptomyces cyaneofuscatus]WTA92189.1 hypothetical protein OG323_25875 [Streptomyces cyaneofuscatus]